MDSGGSGGSGGNRGRKGGAAGRGWSRTEVQRSGDQTQGWGRRELGQTLTMAVGRTLNQNPDRVILGGRNRMTQSKERENTEKQPI